MDSGVEVALPFSGLVTEFLEALIHQILFLRAIYDPQLFERHKLYNIAVRKAIHPGVVAYVSSLTSSMKAAIASGAVSKVVILLLDSKHRGVEKFVVDLKVVTPRKPINPVELQSALRGALLKLSMMDSHLRPLPPGSTFTVMACTNSGFENTVMPQELWAEEGVDSGSGQECTTSAETQPKRHPNPSLDGAHKILPIKSICVSNVLNLQLHIDTCLSFDQT